MGSLSKGWHHFCTITHHKVLVLRHCFHVGLYWQGLVHDLSKYSPTEFKVGVQYYQGDRSPNTAERAELGYSTAWMHHKGRNKHHYQYWTDLSLPEKTVIMPYRYAVEMVCDELAAGITYNGKNWTKDTQLEYYINKERKNLINPHIDNFLMATFIEVSQRGIEGTLTKESMKKLYEKYCVRMEKLDENKI